MIRRYRSALVAALACVSLFAATICFTSDAEAAHGRSKSSHVASAKAGGKAAKVSARKAAAAKSKDKKSTSSNTAVPLPSARPGATSAPASTATIGPRGPGKGDADPQAPLVQAPTADTSDADIALVKSAIENVRRGAASKATETEASISDPVARKLVEWLYASSKVRHRRRRWAAWCWHAR